MQNPNEIQEIERRVTCGHILVFGAQAGRAFLDGSALVELKMANVLETMERMIRLQLKLTPRSSILAIRTRVLIFCDANKYNIGNILG